MEKMKKNIYIFNVIFILLFIVIHVKVYSGVIVNASIALISVAIITTIKPKSLMSTKRFVMYAMGMIIFLILLLPNYTMHTSLEKVEKEYDVSIIGSDAYESKTVPMKADNHVSALFDTNRFYYVSFDKDEERKTMIVSPMTNEITEVN